MVTARAVPSLPSSLQAVPQAGGARLWAAALSLPVRVTQVEDSDSEA